LGIKITGSAQDLDGDLVFLERHAGVIESAVGEIAEQLAKRLRASEAMTINKPIYLLEALLSSRVVTVGQSHVTMGVTVLRISTSRNSLLPVTA
jgi:hypothetical protein